MQSKSGHLPRFFQFIGASAFLVLLALMLMIYMIIDTAVSHKRPMYFESPKWKASSPAGKIFLQDSNVRYRMHKHLISKHGLVGMTRDEIEGLLGPPDRHISNESEIKRYHMSLFPDVTCLDIHIKDAVVAKAEVMRLGAAGSEVLVD